MAAPPNRLALALRGAFRVGVAAGLCAWGISAGWTQLWVVLLALGTMLAANLFVLLRYNPGLLWIRLQPDRPTERFDVVMLWGSLAVMVVLVLVAALDVLRWRLTAISPAWAWAGYALWAVGEVPIAWAMVQNPFLERVVRVQEERGQRVITTGPYRYVRHPMYSGVILLYVGLPLLLGSLLAALPGAVLIGLLVWRTANEDRLLHRDLPGYAEYARTTRWRLVPGVW